MECVEGALKTSLTGEAGLRQNPKGEFEDSVLNAVTCDDDFVDDLLNFSNDDAEDDEKLANDVVELNDRESKRNDNIVLGFDDDNNPPTELTVPADELANLEWLSHFVEDSFTTTPFLSTGVTTEDRVSSLEPGNPLGSEKPCFTTPVPAKARSKRTRTGGRVWSLGSPSFTESSSASTSSSSSSSPTSSWVMVVQSQEPAKKHQKQKKKRAGAGSEAVTGPGLVRRCSHCGVQKTPQWRAGPLGAKTLCNACGVRFKSGRLFPEYRPACSPTFSSDLHSNHHRKVVEMRRKKESDPVVSLQPGLGHPVFSEFLIK